MTREEQNIFFDFFKILVSRDHKELAKFITESLSEKINKSNPDISEGYRNILINQISTICSKVLENDKKFFGGEEIYEINKILKNIINKKLLKFFIKIFLYKPLL